MINFKDFLQESSLSRIYRQCVQKVLKTIKKYIIMDCDSEYDYWACGPEVGGALFDTYFVDEIEDFNSDIGETHNKPFEIAMQYIELKPKVRKKL